MSAGAAERPAAFFGWRVTWAAFAVAVFGWGVGFYGPPVFLHAIREAEDERVEGDGDDCAGQN